MPFKTVTSSGWKHWLWPHPGTPRPGHCSPVVAFGLLCGSFSHPRDCVVPPVIFPPSPHQITYAHSPQAALASPPSLSLSLCTAKSRLRAAEYERNNSGLSGTLCLRWERAAVLRPSQYLDVVAFLCPFLIQAEPSGREPGKGWEGKARVNTENNANGATHNATGKLSQHQLTTEWKTVYCFFKWRLKREQCKKSK